MNSIRRIGNDSEIDKILNRDFTSTSRTGYVEVGEDNFCLPVYYENYEELLRNFEVYDDDVYVCGHPKTGTTWCAEMVWLIVNNLNYEGALKKEVYKRVPQLELCSLFDYTLAPKSFDDGDAFETDNLKYAKETKRPRCLKTHLHWSLLPEQICNSSKKPKMIVILRNSEDTCVSLYYHSQTVERYKGTFEDFCELFLAGRVCFGPFWKQVLSFWNERNRSNILFIRYKEMKDDLPSVLVKVADFLGKKLTEDDITKLSNHLSFKSMKKNPATNHEELFDKISKSNSSQKGSFIRSGKVGGFKSKMSAEVIERFKIWSNENLNGTELSVE